MRYRLSNGVLVPYHGPKYQRGFFTVGPAFFQTGASGAPAHTYATWNPSAKGSGIALSNGNLTATGSTGSYSYDQVLANMAFSVPTYWEVLLYHSADRASGDNGGIGISTSAIAKQSNTAYVGSDSYSAAVWDDGSLAIDNSQVVVGYLTLSTNPIWLKCVFVPVNLSFFIGLVGHAWPSSYGGGVPPAGGPAPANVAAGRYYPATTLSLATTKNYATANFGATAFIDTVPSGCQAGLYT